MNPHHSIYTHDRLDTKQKMMLEVARLLQKLQETIDYHDRLEKSMQNEHLNNLLERIDKPIIEDQITKGVKDCKKTLVL